MNQLEFVHKFADKISVKFNPDLFTRSDDKIVEQLEKIILSCQMEGLYTIRVRGFDVIDDYVKVNEMLRAYYEEPNKKSSRRKRMDEDNRYNFIDLKSSDIKLLIVHYYIAIKGEEENCDVMIALPKVVRKFYFYLNGNYYLPMYQIVDASTYNNSTSKSSKNHRITLKTNFPPINIFRHNYELSTVKGEPVKIVEYDCNVFSKTVPTALFIFAKYGLIQGLIELGVDKIFYISDEPEFVENENWYTFHPKRNPNIYISVPKIMCDGNAIVQHVVYTLCACIDADVTYASLFNRETWIMKLGASFNSANRLAKGYNILTSIESIFDINVQEQLHLPWSDKKDIYAILRWMIREYTSLRQKDTLDVTKKKIRCAEYMAATYAFKLNKNIYRLSNNGNRNDLRSIKKVIYIQPMYLINQLSKGPLLTFRNIVTDMDSFAALKFTYKGISGVGEKTNKIPLPFKLLDISNIGIIDPDASSASDPGVTGSLLPTLRPYEYGYLTDEPECKTWEAEYDALYEKYKEITGLKEIIEFESNVLENEEAARKVALLRLTTEMATKINSTLADSILENQEIPLEGSGHVVWG